MRVKFSTLLASIFFVVTYVPATFADSSWTITTGGTFDWNSGGNWSGNFPPGLPDITRITNAYNSAEVITNMGGSNAIGTTNRINQLIVSDVFSNSPVTVVQAPGVAMLFSNGIQLGQNATLVIVTNAFFGAVASPNPSFNLRSGGQAGTLLLSNAAANSGFSTFVANITSGGAATGVANAGTIQFNPNGNQLVSINYGQTAAFTNDALGTVVMNGTGTGAFIGNFGSGNRAFINSGSIFVSAGTMRIDSRDAFSRGGFQNTATGYVQVNNGGVFELRRTTNSWANGPAVTNLGTVFMNGGTFVALDNDTL